MHIDPTALERSIKWLEETDADVSLEEALERVCRAAMGVFEVDGSGLMFVDESEVLRFVAASDDACRVLEKAEEEINAGPCVSAYVLDRDVRVNDLSTDDRWPALHAVAVEHGVYGVLGVPVHLSGGPVGSLNAFCSRPQTWDDSQAEALHAYARVVEAVIAGAMMNRRQSQVVGQLQYALDNRVMVERAVGMIMGQEGLDALEAFARLRTSSRAARRKVGEVAVDYLAGKPLS
jgi:GAF domain-containing protein